MSYGSELDLGSSRMLESLGEIYEALYSVRRMGFYRVLKELVRSGVRRRTAALQKLRTIAKLHDDGLISLRLDYHIHLMKLGMALVYVPKTVECVKLPPTIPFLRSCLNVVPAGTVLTFYYPETFRPRKLEEVGIQHYTFFERIFSRADISSYASELVENPDSLFSPKKMEDHLRKRLRKDEDNLQHLQAEVFSRELKVRIDNKDLLVLSSMELNPLTTESMDVKLGMKRDTYEKHLEHSERVLRGIRIRKIGNLLTKSRIILMPLIRGKERELLRFFDAVISYPITVSAVVSKDVKLLSVQFLLPPNIDAVRGIATALRDTAQESGLEVAEYFMGDLGTLRNFQVPSVREVEYSPIRKTWLDSSLRMVLKYIKKE
jgi:hypothetical protein